MQFPTIHDIIKLCVDQDITIKYLIDHNDFEYPTECNGCHRRDFTPHNKKWKCCKKKCRKKRCICQNTIFFKSKLKIGDVLLIGYCWLSKITNESVLMILGHSSATISNFYIYYRKLIGDSLNQINVTIGGEGIIVEVDKAKFGKRKYNRGHPVEGCWILGGVERTQDRKAFLIEVPDRTADTLLSIIQKYVLPGSIIYTDCFRSYSTL